eukprot:TRINITY_DN420_c0_g1_i1.p1 TRINITY_DN420_c0_g1~~TRINITY_DN420_c0_g1_i1.p1  ORF type:complete len:104 (+),score=8.15 TRINITY_DN420_c0_g1_i1:134-445(+)
MTQEVNFVHEQENWRQRVRGELVAAKNFSHDWGYLCKPPDVNMSRTRSYETSMIKYQHGGSWTVEMKKIPIRGEKHEVGPLNDFALDILTKKSTKRSAMDSTT